MHDAIDATVGSVPAQDDALEALVLEFRATLGELEKKHPGLIAALAGDKPHREDAFLRFGNAAQPALRANQRRRAS